MLRLLLVLLVCWSGLVVAYDASNESVWSACRPSHCKSTWTSWGGELELHCASASGHFPLATHLTLPLIFEGNYDLCMSFENAHYCRIETDDMSPVIMPIFDGLKPVGGWPLGAFKLDQCVSKDCGIDALYESFQNQVESILARLGIKDTETIRKLFQGVRVTCVNQDETRSLNGTGVLTVAIFFLFVTTVFVATITTTYFPHSSLASKNVIRWFTGNRNSERLVATIPGDFNALNGIRFLSMAWVIIGHTILFYAHPVLNPTAEAKVTRSFSFSLVRSAEFAVDTFFFMSGFLATWGMIGQFKKRSLTPGTYLMLLFGRFMRLTPGYMWLLFFWWKVLPTLDVGPNWENAMRSGPDVCDDRWYYNALYLNNFFPSGKTQPVSSCFGHSWYLALDMQLFLVVPFLVQLYLRGREARSRFGGFLMKYGIPLTCIVLQIIITWVIIIDIGGESPTSDPRFSDRVYTKTYTRWTPYMIGVILAFIHTDRVENHGYQNLVDGEDSWKVWRMKPRKIVLLFLSSIVIMFAVAVQFYFQWKCNEPEHECDVWYGMYLYGFFKLQNWGNQLAAFVYSTCYLFWTAPLALFCYILFCDEQYDLFFLKRFLSHPVFTPLARLTYNAYLVHVPLQVWYHAGSKYSPNWYSGRILLECIGFIFLAYTVSFFLYLIFEKPVMNMVSAMFGVLKKGNKPSANSPPPSNHGIPPIIRDPLPLDREYSHVSDIDSESVHLASPEMQTLHLNNEDDLNVPLTQNLS